MSKIDLSKAKVGDKFRTELGYIVIFTGLYKRGKKYKYMFDRVDDKYYGFLCDINGVPYYNKEMYTIVEQVFDNEKGRAITDKILKDVEKVINGVAEAMPLNESAAIANLPREPLPENNEDEAELQRRQAIVEMAKIEYEKAKELGVAIQNLPYIVEQLKEDNPELQRRQEVLKFADMLFFNQKDTRVALFRYDEAIKVAENIVNIRDEYLKEGKL